MPADDRTRPYDFGDGEQAGSEHATDELELPRPARRPFDADRTAAYPATFDGAATRAFETPTDPYPEAQRPSRPARQAPAVDARAGEYAYDPGRSAPRRAAASPAPRPAPVPVIAPVPSYGAAGYGLPVRDAGPGGLARFGALVLCLLLTAAAVVLFVLGVVSGAIELQSAVIGDALGQEQTAQPAPVAAPVLIGLAALAAFGATLTAGMSGLGVAISGALLLLMGVLTLMFPSLLIDLISAGLANGQIEADGIFAQVLGGAIDDAVRTVVGAVSSLIAVGALMFGAVQLAAGFAVRAARRSGWRRAQGR